MNGLHIIAMGHQVPSIVMENDDFRTYFDTSDEWIRSRTGIRRRHFCGEGESLTTLAIGAAREAMEKAGIPPEKIGLIMVATVNPEYQVPSTACIVQEELGIPAGAMAFDINAACSGFIYELEIAESLMDAGFACGPDRPYGLLIGAEQLSDMLDFHERSVSVLFGDGAAAGVVALTEGCRFYAQAGADGNREVLAAETVGRNDLNIRGDIPLPESVEKTEKRLASAYLHMDGTAVFRFAVRVLDEGISLMEQKSGVPASEIDYIVCHQANRRIIEYVRKKRKLPEDKFFLNLQEYGNTSGASIPLALYDMQEAGLLTPGKRVFCVGFGAGLTWGSAYLEF